MIEQDDDRRRAEDQGLRLLARAFLSAALEIQADKAAMRRTVPVSSRKSRPTLDGSNPRDVDSKSTGYAGSESGETEGGRL